MSGLIKAIIIDDEPKAMKLLEELLVKFTDIQVKETIIEPEKALEAIKTHQPDILFLDIQMPVMDGFEVAKQIETIDNKPEIIFTTSFEHYAIKAIRYAAFDYLMKPIDLSQLKEAIERFIQKKTENKPSQFSEKLKQLIAQVNLQKPLKFSTREGTLYIRQEEIIACEADCNYTKIYLKDGSEEVLSMNIGTLEKILNHPNLIRAGRSAIINKTCIHKINRRTKCCYLKCGNYSCKIKVSASGLKEVEELL